MTLQSFCSYVSPRRHLDFFEMVRNEDDYELAKRFDTVSSQLGTGCRPHPPASAFASHVSHYLDNFEARRKRPQWVT